MPRKPRSTPPKQSTLLEAIKFVSLATRDIGPINETHIYLGGNWAAASNGVIAIATKIEEDVFACPNAKLLQEALSRSTEFELKKRPNDIQLISGKFKANIPCIDAGLLTIPSPDDATNEVTNSLITAFEAAGTLVDENGQDIVDVSMLLNGRSVIASNRAVIFECWHGIDLPTGLSLPKAIVEPLVKAGKKLTKIGGSQSSVTFYFEDESWIKTQLFVKKWPDTVGSLLDRECNPKPVPAGLWEALAAIAPFSTDGACYFENGRILSHPSQDAGASYELAGGPDGRSFTIKQLSLIKPYAKTIDFFAKGPHGGSMAVFFGENIRGCIAGRSK